MRAYKGRRYRFISKTIREKADSIREARADLVELAAQTEEETPEEWLEIRFVKQGHYAIGFLGLQSAVFRVLEGAQNGDVQAIACLAKLNELNELVYNELDYTFERAICDFGAILQPYRTKSA